MSYELTKKEAIKRLREYCPVGTKVSNIIRHVSTSGESRVISSYVFRANGYGKVEKLWISRMIQKALDLPWIDKREGVRVTGCGMDMSAHLVDCLSIALHGGEGKGKGQRDHPARHKVWERDEDNYIAGYSLDSEIL